jgi:hypothetical protein
MSIRELARELYRLQRTVGAVQKALQQADSEKKDSLKQKLRQAEAERNRMKRIVYGQLVGQRRGIFRNRVSYQWSKGESQKR